MKNFSLDDVIEVEDTCMSYLNFKSGISGVFFVTNTNAENDDAQVTVYFENGTAKCTLGELFCKWQKTCANEKAIIGKNYWENMHEKLISDFYDCNKFFNISAIENTMNTVFAMYKVQNMMEKI